MGRRLRNASAAVLLTIGVAACPAPQVPSPLVGQSRFTCCNMHYDRAELSDVNFQTGTLVPVGTRVQILAVKKNKVTFQPEGGAPLTLSLRYGRKQIGFEEYLGRVFVEEDPRVRLRKLNAKTRKQIEQAEAVAGMRRDEVIMALGYPPAHRTPSLDQPDWRYWENRFHQFIVWFDGDKVDRIQP